MTEFSIVPVTDENGDTLWDIDRSDTTINLSNYTYYDLMVADLLFPLPDEEGDAADLVRLRNEVLAERYHKVLAAHVAGQIAQRGNYSTVDIDWSEVASWQAQTGVSVTFGGNAFGDWIEMWQAAHDSITADGIDAMKASICRPGIPS